ncbi:hypothetical protein LTR59_016234 [Friedmanniomyces endolithicus]|nr:hypothetical protein LTR94_017677 [Friedmanniomyces endolithicus]KAK0771082.1 hypothetical protein LTR59_016234 [Friedmanniomyces endolithicus]
MAAQYALAGRSWRSSCESAAGSLLPPLGELSGANGPVLSSVYENHTDDDTAGEATSASPRPDVAQSPWQRQQSRIHHLSPLAACVSAAPQPFQTPSPSAEPDETASIPGLLPLSINTIGSPEDLSAPPTCANSEAATGPTLPVAHPQATSNEEPITLSSNPRSILLLDDVPLATVTVRRKEDDGGAALRCKPPSPLTADVSPPSEDDDATETETVRTKLDHVAKPAAVESDTDDGASSITNGPLSSPLAHKERRIRQTSIQQAPTPAILKTASRWYPHVVKRDRYAKGASQIERLGDAIRASYSNFGIDAPRLIIAPELQPSSPCPFP